MWRCRQPSPRTDEKGGSGRVEDVSVPAVERGRSSSRGGRNVREKRHSEGGAPMSRTVRSRGRLAAPQDAGRRPRGPSPGGQVGARRNRSSLERGRSWRTSDGTCTQANIGVGRGQQAASRAAGEAAESGSGPSPTGRSGRLPEARAVLRPVRQRDVGSDRVGGREDGPPVQVCRDRPLSRVHVAGRGDGGRVSSRSGHSDCRGGRLTPAGDGHRGPASPCDEEIASDGPAPNDKPRVDAGLCETLLDCATKRVMRFELTTFTLAT
jgi:hypothetical protein